METREQKRLRAQKVLERLVDIYGNPRTELNYANPYQLFVAVILSAQSTDKKVNEITPRFFSRFPDFFSLAEAQPEHLYPYIKEIGLYRNKAKNLVSSSRKIIEEFKGKLPGRLEQLITLPGIGRKSANVLLANLFGKDTITVDTHVMRLSQRLGFTTKRDPVKIEFELMEVWPKGNWSNLSHCLILHGRRVCKARSPRCYECVLDSICPKVWIVRSEKKRRRSEEQT